MIDMIYRFDVSVLYWIQNNLRNDAITPFWVAVTTIGEKGIGMIALCVLLLAIRKTRRMGCFMVLALATQGILVNLVLKVIVARPRPYNYDTRLVPLVEKLKDYSFPSGHTCACAALCFACFFAGYKLWGWVLMAFTLLMAASRLYLGMHFPTDVLGGFIAGIICAMIADWIGRRIEEKMKEKRALPPWRRK